VQFSSTLWQKPQVMLKKQLYMEHNHSKIVCEYNGSLSCDRHLKLLFGVLCGVFMNIRGMNQFTIGIALALVLMYNFDLFLDTSYLNIIVCFIVPLPNSHPAVFIVCCGRKVTVS
jgi:hypothetical protein